MFSKQQNSFHIKIAVRVKRHRARRKLSENPNEERIVNYEEEK